MVRVVISNIPALMRWWCLQRSDCEVAELFGIALSCSSQFDYPGRNCFAQHFVRRKNMKCRARALERDAHHTNGFGIEFATLQIDSDRHLPLRVPHGKLARFLFCSNSYAV